MVASSFLPQGVRSTRLRSFGKFLASLNVVWILFICTSQFGNFFSRCYCSSSVLGLRGRAYAEFVFTADDLGKLKSAWTGAAVLGNGASLVFLIFVFWCYGRQIEP